MVIEQYHPGSTSLRSFREIFGDSHEIEGTALAVGDHVFLSKLDGKIAGRVESVDLAAGTAAIITAVGAQHDGPLWRLTPVHEDHAGLDEDELVRIMQECGVCGQPTLDHRLGGAACADHALCPECCVNSLWAGFTGGALPLVCGVCQAPVDLRELKGTRWLAAMWSSKHPHLPLDQFAANVEERLARKRAGPIRWEDLDAETRGRFEAEIAAGQLMRCLGAGCGQLFARDGGCNWVKCIFCSTEHCWATKLLAGVGPGKCGGGHACHY
jgi:hypothetical protein